MPSTKTNYQDLEERTFQFAVKVVKTILKLPTNNVATWKIGGQVINSSSSINSNIVQAKAGLSKPDFIKHFKIARKEAKETKRWLQMLVAIELLSVEIARPLIIENEEIIRILVKSIKTAEANR